MNMDVCEASHFHPASTLAPLPPPRTPTPTHTGRITTPRKSQSPCLIWMLTSSLLQSYSNLPNRYKTHITKMAPEKQAAH